MSDNNEMVDGIVVCLYCSELMDAPTEKQLKLFGFPNCCGFDMLKVDRNQVFKIVQGLDNLKAKLEKEILRGMI